MSSKETDFNALSTAARNASSDRGLSRRKIVLIFDQQRSMGLGSGEHGGDASGLEGYRQLWDTRFDALDRVVEELKRKEQIDGRNERR